MHSNFEEGNCIYTFKRTLYHSQHTLYCDIIFLCEPCSVFLYNRENNILIQQVLNCLSMKIVTVYLTALNVAEPYVCVCLAQV